MFKRIKKYFLKRKMLLLWKEEKRKKWLSEGRSGAEVKRLLKLHKVKF